MKRDLELIRTVLTELEERGTYGKWVKVQAEGYSPEQIAYHVKLLHDAGLIEAVNRSTTLCLDWKPTLLTWRGHEFLDATRNDSVWHQVKARLKDHGLDAPLGVVQELAIKIISGSLGLGGG